VDGQLGLEPTPEEYIQNMVAVFREVKRVLRDDGTCWVNMGDSYAQTTLRHRGGIRGDRKERLINNNYSTVVSGLKPKDLCGIPWMLAFALRADGWYLRSEIIWAKPNPMPESVTDRPTKSHEQIFLLSKKPKYFYDADAIREPHKLESLARYEYGLQASAPKDGYISAGSDTGAFKSKRMGDHMNYNGRNKRTVWEIATQAYPDAHFATFPEKLVVPCIKAGTSEKGCCLECGAPWERVVEKTTQRNSWGDRKNSHTNYPNEGRCGDVTSKTIGWRSTCKHKGEPVSCVVFDPFGGSGTVKNVAERLGRRAVVTDLKFEYCQMAKKRCERLPELFE
jgi:DNA modification methylase